MAVLRNLLIMYALTHATAIRKVTSITDEGRMVQVEEKAEANNTDALEVELLNQGACGEPQCVDCDNLPTPTKETEIKFYYKEWCPCAQQIFALLNDMGKLKTWFARVEKKCISSLMEKVGSANFAKWGWIDPNEHGAPTSNCQPWIPDRDHPYGTNENWEELGNTDKTNPYLKKGDAGFDATMQYHMNPAIVINGKKYVGTSVILGWLERNAKNFLQRPSDDIPLQRSGAVSLQDVTSFVVCGLVFLMGH